MYLLGSALHKLGVSGVLSHGGKSTKLKFKTLYYYLEWTLSSHTAV